MTAPRAFTLLLALLLLGQGPAQAEPEQAGLRLTTNTLEYCQNLAQRLDSMPGRSRTAAQRLGQEGRRLCARGQIRTGIARLRRAIRLAAGTHSSRG